MTSIIRVSAGVLTRGRQLLICQRRAEDPHPLKWEFPGGKAEEGEDEGACLQRELREELAIEATVGVELHRAVHTYPNGRTVALTFFHVPTYSGELRNLQFHSALWVEPTQLSVYDFLEGDLAFVTALAGGKWSHIFSAGNNQPIF
jgi:8-oxo-dGTP diphosphatase